MQRDYQGGSGWGRVTMQMIVDHMDEQFWELIPHHAGERLRFSGCALYHGQRVLREDTIYLLPEGTEGFPTGRYSYITPDDLPGGAPHIRRVNQSLPVILNLVMEVFRSYREYEMELSSICNSGGTLQDLCVAGSGYFNNPVYIHDELFSILGASRRFAGMLKFDYNEQTGKRHLPLWLINDFRLDPDYQKTLTTHCAAIWSVDNNAYPTRSLYVNLWDEGRYRGRLLVGEIASSLQPGQFDAAELLAEYAVMLLRRDERRHVHPYHNFEQTMMELVETGNADHRDIQMMLDILDWEKKDTFLCIRLRSQRTADGIPAGGVLGSHLASSLNSYYSFYRDRGLYIVVNLSRGGQSASAIRQVLAPYVRDSFMYGGISNPVTGLHQLRYGFMQTEFILEYLDENRSGIWLLPYQDCALEYLRATVADRMPAEVLAAPALLRLRQLDGENDTEYYKTLKVYLTMERDIPRAAQELIIHRTTLSYRLRKIQELVNLNLEDPGQRLYLLWSFHLLEGTEH